MHLPEGQNGQGDEMIIGPGLPGYNYTKENIIANAPKASGVYVIFTPTKWVYVGEGDDIRVRLLAHFNGDNQRITRESPTGYQFELVNEQFRVARLDAYIAKLEPVANQRFG